MYKETKIIDSNTKLQIGTIYLCYEKWVFFFNDNITKERPNLVGSYWSDTFEKAEVWVKKMVGSDITFK